VRHNETPGLGARIDEAWFLRQLAGRRPPLSLAPEGTRSPEPGRIDAITGATITSAAVRDILNRTAASAPDTVNVKRGDA
jgi:Na+-translocating ferredoxin:NAD+ oxidoreductase RnfG subunit